MNASAEFRILSESTDPIAETIAVIYRDVKQFGKISVLASEPEVLEQISESLWRNAKDDFVTYQFATSNSNSAVNVLLCNSVHELNNGPALCVINYLLDPADLRFRKITEIVKPASETVDKARRQYKMYRSAGLQVSHLEC